MLGEARTRIPQARGAGGWYAPAPMARLPAFLLTVSVLLEACSGSSVLVRGDDQTFRDSEQRLARTAAEVRASAAAEDEKTLFLQAEGFYRYRFEPTGQGGESFFAEAAAALTDFPAFQALAGSLDLQDIRIKSYDAAVQLWETLLARHPRTQLKPLTLYRLGWAYRSAGVSSLPRENPNDAFGELIRTAPDSPLAPLAKDAESVPYKSRSSAGAWSIFPGGGQLYLGRTGSGLARLGVALASVAAVVVPVVIAARRGNELTWKRDWPLLGVGVLGLSVLSLDYTLSYEDAIRGAVRWNEAREGAFVRAHPGSP